MTQEQLVIKHGDTEIPLVALDSPLMWVITVLLFLAFTFFVWRKFK